MRARSLGREDPLEDGVAAHSRILAWRTPGTEEPGGLQSVQSWRVRHDRAAEDDRQLTPCPSSLAPTLVKMHGGHGAL